MIKQGPLETIYTKTGRVSTYRVEFRHEGLNEIKHVSGRDEDILNAKMNNLINRWDIKWNNFVEKQKKEKEKERLANEEASKEQLAKEKNENAKKQLSAIENVLNYTLDINDAVDWDSLKDLEPFKFENKGHQFISFRKKDGYPDHVNLIEIPSKPIDIPSKSIEIPSKPDEKEFCKQIPFIKSLLGQKKKIEAKQNEAYQKALAGWVKEKREVDRQNEERKKEVVRQNEERKKELT